MGRTRLVPQVIEKIIDQVLNGRLKPGEQINQFHLAKELGVSATPLREALHVLAGEGLFRLSKGSGVSVAPLTTAGILENTELALALEVAALRQAIPKLTEADLDALEMILDQVSQMKDNREWYPLTWSFYRGLLAPSGYWTFLEIIRKSIFQNMLVLPLYIKIGPRIRKEEPNLRTVLAACRRKDVEGAIEALEIFNRKACQATVAFIRERLEMDQDLPVIRR
jgi:DNA-binding GntR family transcriptional regulator